MSISQGGLPESRSLPYTELEHSKIKQLSTNALTTALEEHSDSLCIRFASGISGYFAKYDPSREGFIVIVSGPHGDESGLAGISGQNITLLHDSSEQIEFRLLTESPFNSKKVD